MATSRRRLNEIISENKELNTNEKFMKIAHEVSNTSTCARFGKKNGAVIVDEENRILATGYNGAPEMIKSCKEKGYCFRKKNNIESGTRVEECFALHAEQSALMQAAKEGVSVEGATLYIIRKPCVTCLKLLLSSGIKKVFYQEENFDSEVYKEIYKESKIKLVKIPYEKEGE